MMCFPELTSGAIAPPVMAGVLKERLHAVLRTRSEKFKVKVERLQLAATMVSRVIDDTRQENRTR